MAPAQLLGLLAIIVLPVFLLWYLLFSNNGAKKPWWIVTECIGFGLVAVAIAAIAEIKLIPDLALLNNPFNQVSELNILRASIMTSIIEEAAKFLPLALFIARRPYFRTVRDGVIYFAIAGLAFGFVENLLYFIRFGGEISLYRSAVLIFFHAATNGIIGYFFARAKVHKTNLGGTFAALGSVIVLHAIYNTAILIATPPSILLALFITFGLNICFFMLYIRSAKN